MGCYRQQTVPDRRRRPTKQYICTWRGIHGGSERGGKARKDCDENGDGVHAAAEDHFDVLLRRNQTPVQ